MIVAVFGSRDWRDMDTIDARLAKIPKGTIVVHGGSPGAGALAQFLARKHGLRPVPVPHHTFPSTWERNTFLVELLRPGTDDFAFAFHKNNSPGTRDEIEKAQARGIRVEVIRG